MRVLQAGEGPAGEPRRGLSRGEPRQGPGGPGRPGGPDRPDDLPPDPGRQALDRRLPRAARGRPRRHPGHAARCLESPPPRRGGPVSDSDVLLSERVAEKVHLLTLNRPDRLNTMTAELCEALHRELAVLEADRSCRAIVITGAGRGFCAGLDLEGYGESPGADGSDASRDRSANQMHMSRLILRLRSTPQPVIAAVNGPAAGFGLALTLGSDIRFAAESAVFRVIFVNIGVSNCDMGVSWLLPRLIGASRSHELMLTGRRVRAEEAERIGLVADVVEDGKVVERAIEAANEIAAWSPWGTRLTKQGMWAALEIPSEQAAIEYEDRQQIMATTGIAPGEAVQAFLEKRTAEFLD